MRILLVQPPKSPMTIGGEDIHMFEPLSLEYVGAGVIDDHEVKLIDLRLEPDLAGALREFEPELVGMTALTVHVKVVKKLMSQVKSWRDDVVTVVGGHHATVAPDDFICPQIDLIVSGEAVIAFRELVERLEEGGELDGIPGLTFKDAQGHLTKTPEDPDIDLESQPLPARSLTAKHRGRYFTQWMKPMAAIITSKGCPFRCSFCSIWKLTGGKRLVRSPENIIKELLTIKEPWVFFADYESLIDVSRMKELATRIADAGIRKRYCLYGRADTIVRHPELLEQWRDIGLDTVIVGFEFFRDEDLASVNKGTTTRENERAIDVLNSLGLNIGAYFMVKPEFTHDDFEGLRKYLKKLKLKFASIFVLTPLPGTDLYDEKRKDLLTNDPELFDFFHSVLPTTLPLREFYDELYRTYQVPLTPRSALSLLGNFRWTEIPASATRMRRVMKRLRKAHLDYD